MNAASAIIVGHSNHFGLSLIYDYFDIPKLVN